jgi:ACR3 family arsenite transporter
MIMAQTITAKPVSTATALYGPESAAMATVVGVLVEVPVMLSVFAA